MKTSKITSAIFLLAFAAADSGFCKAPDAKPSAIVEPDCPGPGCPRGRSGDWQGDKAVFDAPAAKPGGEKVQAVPAGQPAKASEKKPAAKKPAAGVAKDN